MRVTIALLFFIIVTSQCPRPGGGTLAYAGRRSAGRLLGTSRRAVSGGFRTASIPVLTASCPSRLKESLLVEVDRVSEARLHLWYLVADDLHQHFGELHLQRLRLTEGVEAEVQQVPHELHDTQTTS